MSDAAYTEELQRIAPGVCIACAQVQDHEDGCRLNRFPIRRLVIDAPRPGAEAGWGYIGNRIISHAIIELWLLNKFLEPASEEATGLWVLTERGQMAADFKLKDDEILRPKGAWHPGKDKVDTSDIVDVPIEGLLFTTGGTCTLCGKQMDVFGQVSHAKSHINKGHPVTIEEVSGKKVLRVAPGTAPILPAKPAPVPLDDPGDFAGAELFSSTSRCRLCPDAAPVHKFGQISHAKSHIKKKDPVEIRFIGKKNVPMLTDLSAITEPSPRLPQMQPGADLVDLPEDMTMQDRVREEGIDALLTIQRVAGLDVDRKTAGEGWDKMGPVSRMQTMRAAEALEGK